MLAAVLRNCDHINTMLMKLLEDKTTSTAILHAELPRGEVPLQQSWRRSRHGSAATRQENGRENAKAVPTDLSLNADPFLCKQILLNLVSNALKYTHQGTITLGGTAGEGAASFWVSDTGNEI